MKMTAPQRKEGFSEKRKEREERRELREKTRKEKELSDWIPKTETGKLVKEGKIENYNQLLSRNLPVLEPEIIDFLIPNLQEKVIEIRKGRIHTFVGGIDYYLIKREELHQNETDKKLIINEEENVSKKKQKRIEAENRQAKYQATKDVISKISELEKEIELLERREKHLEQTLADQETYNNPNKATELNTEFIKVKKELSDCLIGWENLNEELSNIESQFS